MKSKNLFTKIIFLALLTILFISCADVSPHVGTCITSDPYGFWSGLCHGLILPFSWIGSLFSDSIAIYAYDNDGGWYDFGFILGTGSLFGGGSRVSK